MSDALTDIQDRLAVVLDTMGKAKPGKPEDNPLHNHDLDQIMKGASILKHADLMPQRDNKSGQMLGPNALNQVIREGLEARSQGRKDQRKKVARARAQRIQQINAAADAPIQPEPLRLVKAWAVMRPLMPIVTRIANTKAAWARRYLGHVQDDVTMTALTKMVLVLAKGDQDLDLLALAASQLAGETERIPGDQIVDDAAKKEHKAQAKARKWLMGMINNRVMGALVDLYTERHNLRWENLDVIDTIMASINGAGEDPMVARHNASKPPSFIASKMMTPGNIHPDVVRAALAGAITDRRLDALVELLTDQNNLRTDGAFKWSDLAEQVFLCTPDGATKWELVCFATENHKNPRASRAYVAREFVRQQFAFLPWLIASVVNACDAEPVGWRDGHAIMASAFDPDAFDENGARVRPGYLVPSVTYTDAREAARIITESLACVLAEFTD